jgi:hypothetical protein
MCHELLQAAWQLVVGRDDCCVECSERLSQYHPDKVMQLGEQLADAKSKEINAVYDTAMWLRRR